MSDGQSNLGHSVHVGGCFFSFLLLTKFATSLLPSLAGGQYFQTIILLWGCSIQFEVFKFQPDPFILQGQEGEGALADVHFRIEKNGSLERPVLCGSIGCRNELLIAGCSKKKITILNLS